MAQILALPGKLAAGRQHICGSPHTRSARREHSPVAASIDAFGLAAWGCECLIEVKHRTDPALAREQLAQSLLAFTAKPSVDSALDEQVLALP